MLRAACTRLYKKSPSMGGLHQLRVHLDPCIPMITAVNQAKSQRDPHLNGYIHADISYYPALL